MASAWTRWAIAGHFAFAAAELDEADYERHYAADAVFVTPDGVASGRAGFCAYMDRARRLLGDGVPVLRDIRTDGTRGVAVCTWRRRNGSSVTFTDSFVVLGMRIALQTSNAPAPRTG